MNNKAQIGNLQGIIVTLIVVGLVLGIGFYVLEQFQDQTIKDGSETYTNASNVTAHTFTTPRVVNDTNFKVYNSTILVGAGNYSLTADSDGYITQIILTDAGNTLFGGEDLTINFKYHTSAYVGVGGTIDAVNKVPTWLGVLVILAVVGIIMAIVFTVLPKGGIGKGGGGEIAEI